MSRAEESIQTIMAAIAPIRDQNDDGKPSIMQRIIEMHMRCLIENGRKPAVDDYSSTTIDTKEGIALVSALEYILQEVRNEAHR